MNIIDQLATTDETNNEHLNALEAYTLLALMQEAVDSVPSYVETRAIETWIENSLEQQ